VFGDFNMNPFEAGIVGSGGMHAVQTRLVAKGAPINNVGELTIRLPTFA
jgi:hypothetical protein